MLYLLSVADDLFTLYTCIRIMLRYTKDEPKKSIIKDSKRNKKNEKTPRKLLHCAPFSSHVGLLD